MSEVHDLRWKVELSSLVLSPNEIDVTVRARLKNDPLEILIVSFAMGRQDLKAFISALDSLQMENQP